MIGKYIDRVISQKEVNTLEDIKINNLSDSSVLLWVGDENWDERSFVQFIEGLFRKEAIAICVSGKGVKEQFDLMLNTQSKILSKKHTMTYMFTEKNIEDVLENFFYVSYPDGERWDDWKKYLIIVVGDSKISNKIKNLVKEKWND